MISWVYRTQHQSVVYQILNYKKYHHAAFCPFLLNFGMIYVLKLEYVKNNSKGIISKIRTLK